MSTTTLTMLLAGGANLLPALFLLLALPFLWAYPVTRAKHVRTGAH